MLQHYPSGSLGIPKISRTAPKWWWLKLPCFWSVQRGQHSISQWWSQCIRGDNCTSWSITLYAFNTLSWCLLDLRMVIKCLDSPVLLVTDLEENEQRIGSNIPFWRISTFMIYLTILIPLPIFCICQNNCLYKGNSFFIGRHRKKTSLIDLKYIFIFQIVKFVSKEVKTKKDVRKIFRVLQQTVYADNDSSKVNVSAILTRQKDSLIHIMGQEFYAALKANKFVAGEI